MDSYLRYFDNSATSFPKPPEVKEYICNYLASGGTYGRGAYPRIIEATSMVEEAREKICNILSAQKPENVVFTSGSTEAINTILYGLHLIDKVILVSPLEHNAVMRPIQALSLKQNTKYLVLEHYSDGTINVERIKSQLSQNVALVVVNHQSNVNGVIQPIEAIKREIGIIPILVDASQSMGTVSINVDKDNLDFVAFTGHKGLMGPTGTGGFYLANPALISPLLYGGTGSNSDSFELPEAMPDKFQAGTPNLLGLSGLLGALNARVERRHTKEDYLSLLQSVRNIKNIDCFSGNNPDQIGEVFSFRIVNENPGITAHKLYSEFGIETRSGLHCAPLAHKTLGSFPTGLVRISLSPYHTTNDLGFLLLALKHLAK
ncbi:aminotransferase class V-fold PLP-dependent enzyme [Williamwhitmania taraxaci]|uniref:Cysteine desulfurase family protein n=1 Tax=Williamwhitmania taraxaci TaxID=1640674 RepID=A0A1G6HJE3_9BACT|nr:aminotransferase class V-fold PLP-dependent enzyme [Williamwhitmania taraxaci]SDB94379.1 cysteine desulfurase family protein [Williamwhitmania taraxaci]